MIFCFSDNNLKTNTEALELQKLNRVKNHMDLSRHNDPNLHDFKEKLDVNDETTTAISLKRQLCIESGKLLTCSCEYIINIFFFFRILDNPSKVTIDDEQVTVETQTKFLAEANSSLSEHATDGMVRSFYLQFAAEQEKIKSLLLSVHDEVLRFIVLSETFIATKNLTQKCNEVQKIAQDFKEKKCDEMEEEKENIDESFNSSFSSITTSIELYLRGDIEHDSLLQRIESDLLFVPDTFVRLKLLNDVIVAISGVNENSTQYGKFLQDLFKENKILSTDQLGNNNKCPPKKYNNCVAATDKLCLMCKNDINRTEKKCCEDCIKIKTCASLLVTNALIENIKSKVSRAFKE